MSIQKPSLPKGTRDFSPLEMSRRNYILNIITDVYRKYGFEQIETPAMENLSTLTGKYGEEGDQLLFKILNSRIHESRNKEKLMEAFSQSLEKSLNSDVLTERALRYDLTVPFARYVVMHQNEITFPFKRFQIQPVWRADRPQKGRYREFYQCDADVVGSDSLLNEADLVYIMDEVFSKLGINASILINNRKILSGIAEIAGVPESITDITVAIDKIDKIGMDKVIEELTSKGLSSTAIEKIRPLLGFKGNTNEKLAFLKSLLKDSETGMKGISELETVLKLAPVDAVEADITLARGLNYYTGAIFEVRANDVKIGSITGGGRYDNLTGVFGLPGVSGVGISFGIDRIYDVMDELGLFNNSQFRPAGTKILFVNFGGNELQFSLDLVRALRNNNIAAELYPDPSKMKKQMSYADSKQIPFVALAGSDEINSGTVTIKNMQTGTQTSVKAAELTTYLSTHQNSPS